MDRPLVVYNVPTEQQGLEETGKAQLTSEGYSPSFKWTNSCCFAGDDKFVAASSATDNDIHIWPVSENQGRADRVIDQSLLSLRGHRKEIFNVRYSKATSTLASCGAETTIKLWSLNSDYHSNLSRS